MVTTIAALLVGASLLAPTENSAIIASIGQRSSHNGRYTAEVTESMPLSVGTHSWTIHVAARGARRVAHADVAVRVWCPDSREHVRRIPSARYLGRGDYRVDGIDFPHAGWWNVSLIIDGNAGVDSVAFNVVLPEPATTKAPVIAIVGDSAGVEITDFMVPRAVLSASGAARVVTVAQSSAQFHMFPTPLSTRPDMTFAVFDSAFVPGATYVIVPALVDRDSPKVAAWLRAQASRGATVVSICDGAWTVANAGLFNGKHATGHWHSLPDLAKRYENTVWERNSRYVTDGSIISTTGVSASIPLSLYLVERIAGRAAADSVAAKLGVAEWGTAHHSDEYSISKWQYTKAFVSHFAWWRHDRVAIPVRDGIDEVALALTVDAVPRTMRGEPVLSSASFVGGQGLRLFVDSASLSKGNESKVLRIPEAPSAPAAALDSAIARLKEWYGAGAADLIAIGMEYKPAIGH